ncbi:hypothetical protein [Streptomyces capitiformicae]|uniref:Uncharacterized protein n=1 Tax=Streptomyces capitiformicae TaxID=2014920 RepID=A0A919DBU8_9ACTN|nr:hypothetical protein [Streptomyces capitiformicae]GHE29062.1 hypothetical protein GCM10017771_44520 [Streptomyces capitiformicae]
MRSATMTAATPPHTPPTAEIAPETAVIVSAVVFEPERPRRPVSAAQSSSSGGACSGDDELGVSEGEGGDGELEVGCGDWGGESGEDGSGGADSVDVDVGSGDSKPVPELGSVLGGTASVSVGRAEAVGGGLPTLSSPSPDIDPSSADHPDHTSKVTPTTRAAADPIASPRTRFARADSPPIPSPFGVRIPWCSSRARSVLLSGRIGDGVVIRLSRTPHAPAHTGASP